LSSEREGGIYGGKKIGKGSLSSLHGRGGKDLYGAGPGLLGRDHKELMGDCGGRRKLRGMTIEKNHYRSQGTGKGYVRQIRKYRRKVCGGVIIGS